MDFKKTWALRTYSFFKTPMVSFVGPRVERLDEELCHIVIPLRFHVKNPLGSMFLGALTIGGDLAGSLIAYFLVRERKLPVSIVFRSMKVDFLRRPESDVSFICREGAKVVRMVEQTMATGERCEETLTVEATCDENGQPVKVAQFELILSVKKKTKKS